MSKGEQFDYKGSRGLSELKTFVTGGFRDTTPKKIAKASTHDKPKDDADDEAAADSKVVRLTRANFEALVENDEKNGWMLKFYAPWCGHCKRLAPVWTKLSVEMDGTDTKVGKIDCTQQRRLCSRFGVSGYPTLRYIRQKQMYPIQTKRALESLKDFAIRGWKGVPKDPIPDESVGSTIVDGVLEWAYRYPIAAAITGVGALVLCVAMLVTLLDYCMGGEELESEAKVKSVEKKKDD